MSCDMSTAEEKTALTERKRQILEEAIEIISSEGYANLSMRALARASGMKLGALQYHFRTWEDLLRALAAYISDAYRRSFEALDLNDGEPSLKDLVRIALVDPEELKDLGDGLFTQLWAMARVEPLIHEKLHEFYAAYVGRIAERLTALGSRAPAAEALAIMSLLEGTIVFIGDDRRWANHKDAVHDAVRKLLEARYGDWKA